MITNDELIKKVRFLINEADGENSIPTITDDLRCIDDTISELMPQAVAIVQRQSNGKNVNVKKLFSSEAQLRTLPDGFGEVDMPEDFADLLSVKLKSWRIPCIQLSSHSSVEILHKLGGYLSAVASKPVCAEDYSEEGNKVLKLFPVSDSAVLEYLVYEAQYDVATGLNLCDSRMADAVSYVCAALLYNVFERYDAAKSFMSFAAALCGENVK